MAIKQLFPSGKIVSLVALVSILAVAFGVLSLFGTQSVMNGFHDTIITKIKDTSGDIKITANGAIMQDDALINRLRSDPQVQTVEKIAFGPVQMMAYNTPVYPILRSYDTISQNCVLPLLEKGFVRESQLDELDDDTVLLSTRLAARLGIDVGEFVEIYSPSMFLKLSKGEIVKPTRLEVAGYVDTDFSRVDENLAVVSLRRMQDFYSLGNGYHEIAIRLKEGVDEDDFLEKLNVSYQYRAMTWLTGNAEFMRVIIMEKVMLSLIMAIIIVVAAFLIFSSLYTAVLRKTKEIGLSVAMGARPLQIVSCYCLQGFIIGILGCITGLIFTLLLLHFKDPIAGFIVGQETLSKFYMFSHLPVKYELKDFMHTAIFSVIICTFAGFFPAIRAARLKASEAMRNE